MPTTNDGQAVDVIIFAVISTLALLLIVGSVITTLLCLVVRRTKTRGSYSTSHDMVLIQSSSSPVLGLNLHFIERIGHGRFASVWRAKMASELSTEIVAVKVFATYPRNHLESFEHELDMYLTTELQHKNVLRYVFMWIDVTKVSICAQF